MARKSKDAIFESFLADLKAINPKIEEALTDEKVSAKLREGVLARADYSQSMDDLKTERESFAQEVQQARTKIDAWQSWYNQSSQEYAKVTDELKAYKEEFGDLDTSGQRREAAKHGMTTEQFQKMLNDEIQKRDVAALKFVDDLTDLKIEHRDRFKEKLDTEAVYKIAGEKGLPLDVAYQVFVADKVEAQQKADFEEKLKAAREEGFKDALSKHNLPVISNNSDVVHVLDVKDAPRNAGDRISAAVAAFAARNR